MNIYQGNSHKTDAPHRNKSKMVAYIAEISNRPAWQAQQRG